MAAASATEAKLENFVNGKSRCFKHTSCRYRHHNKSCVINGLFEEWVGKLDRQFHNQEKK